MSGPHLRGEGGDGGWCSSTDTLFRSGKVDHSLSPPGPPPWSTPRAPQDSQETVPDPSTRSNYGDLPDLQRSKGGFGSRTGGDFRHTEKEMASVPPTFPSPRPSGLVGEPSRLTLRPLVSFGTGLVPQMRKVGDSLTSQFGPQVLFSDPTSPRSLGTFSVGGPPRTSTAPASIPSLGPPTSTTSPGSSPRTLLSHNPPVRPDVRRPRRGPRLPPVVPGHNVPGSKFL